MKKPIIIIPGIQGTKLFNINQSDNKTIWSGFRKFFSNIHELTLQKDGTSDHETEAVIERADIENMAYSEIINYLRSKGYSVFIFGYDWRKSNMESGIALGIFINKLKNKLNRGSFNLLTHSMGALVVSAYIKTLNKTERNKIINKIIFTVPPFLGSVEAAFNLLIGKSRLLNTSDDFRKVARTFPAIYELLPIYAGAYGFERPSRAAKFDPFKFSTYWQQVSKVNREDTKIKHRLITHRLKELGEIRDQNHFIFDFANCDKKFRDKLLVICGGDVKTKERIHIQEKKGHIKFFFDFEYYSEDQDGDGTVPFKSSTAFKDDILTIKVNHSLLETWANSWFIMSDWHSFLLNNGRVQNVIKRFLKAEGDLSEDWYESLSGGVEKVE